MKRADQLFRAYRASCYLAGAQAARIGQRAPGLDALLGSWTVSEGVFIAAGNPFSQRKPEGWNARRQRALREHLRGLPYVEGQGGAVLARRFRQMAMVGLRRGGRARLIWVF